MLKSIRIAVALALFAGPALAQSKTLTVAAYGGVWDQHLRKEVFPDFEKKHGVKIDYVAGNSTDTLAKLQAQKKRSVLLFVERQGDPRFAALRLTPAK